MYFSLKSFSQKKKKKKSQLKVIIIMAYHGKEKVKLKLLTDYLH